MCVYQFRHLGNATHNFTFPTRHLSKKPPTPQTALAARHPQAGRKKSAGPRETARYRKAELARAPA